MSRLVVLLEQFLIRYIIPNLYEKFVDWVTDLIERGKVQRAYKKATQEAKEKYDQVFKNPESTVEQKASAIADLINHKPTGL